MNAFRLLVAFICCVVLLPFSHAEQGYQTPSPDLAAVVDAKLAPTSYLSSDGQWLALFERRRVVSLDELAIEELNELLFDNIGLLECFNDGYKLSLKSDIEIKNTELQ